jgi:hypothetical protein
MAPIFLKNEYFFVSQIRNAGKRRQKLARSVSESIAMSLVYQKYTNALAFGLPYPEKRYFNHLAGGVFTQINSSGTLP